MRERTVDFLPLRVRCASDREGEYKLKVEVLTTPTQLRFFVKSTHFGLLQALGASAAPMHGPQASPHPRGGLTWAIDPSLCAALMDRFDAETFDYFGVRLFSFVSCEEITDALIRGFSTWSANHGRLHFYSTTRECAGPSNNPAAECSFAEVVITGGATPHGVPLEAWTNTSTLDAASGDVIGDLGSGDGATTRVTLSFDTSTTCYYMDSTVCDTLRNLRFRTPLLSWFDPLITARALLYLPALFGLVYLTHNLVLVTYRSRKAGWAHWLYVLTSLSHRWRLLTLLLAIPPLVDWKMLLPCQKCVAFETLATHAAGARPRPDANRNGRRFFHCHCAKPARIVLSSVAFNHRRHHHQFSRRGCQCRICTRPSRPNARRQLPRDERCALIGLALSRLPCRQHGNRWLRCVLRTHGDTFGPSVSRSPSFLPSRSL